jgi:hypothetical protein
MPRPILIKNLWFIEVLKILSKSELVCSFWFKTPFNSKPEIVSGKFNVKHFKYQKDK